MKRFLFLIVYSLLGCGCFFSPQKDVSKFYALGFNNIHEKVSSYQMVDTQRELVYLDLEEIPAYTDVAQIVSLQNGCELVRSEVSRWGEPFKVSVARSLYTHLAKQLADTYSVVLLPSSLSSREYIYKISVKIINFIFDKDNNELCLSATITIFKQGKLYVICDYNDCFKIGSNQYDTLVKSMDWELNMLSEFIGRCINTQVVRNIPMMNSAEAIAEKDDKNLQNANVPFSNTNVMQEDVINKSENQPRVINITAHGEVYVIVDNENGDIRYFSGRLFNGSSIDVECDSAFKVISTDDSLIEVR